MKYLSALVESALRSSIQQKNNLKTQIPAILNDNVEFHLMTQVTLYDLKRITEVLNLENYLLAYTNHYDNNRGASVKEFKDIIASVDFLYDVFNQIIEQLKKSQMFDYERKMKLQAIFANVYNLSGKLVIRFERHDPQSYQEFLHFS